MPNECKDEAKPRNSEVHEANGNIWRQTQRYKQRREWTKCHIMKVVLTSFAWSVYRNVFSFVSFFRSDLLRRSVCTKTSCKYIHVKTSHPVKKPLIKLWKLDILTKIEIYFIAVVIVGRILTHQFCQMNVYWKEIRKH